MKLTILYCGVVLLNWVGWIHAAETLTLVRDGRSDFVIAVEKDASPVTQTAARELQANLQLVTGAVLKIVATEQIAADALQILVGASPRLTQIAPELHLDTLGYDGIVMRTLGNRLILAGHPKRGTLYAVYTFLEDVVGIRWWTSSETAIPTKPTLTIPPLNVTYVPPLRYREAHYLDASKGLFAAHCKCNGHGDDISAEYGGHNRFAIFVHSFYKLLPPEKYFRDHPDWYSLIHGKRTADQAQLCLANEEMRKELVKNALEEIRHTPEVGYISISQNDWFGRCECDQCKNAEEEEGSPSGPLLRFVNKVAADIEKEFPQVMVETLAYQYTRQPPKLVRPRGNVVVRLCSIECSFAQPLSEPENEKFRNDIEGWSEIAPQLFIWDYVTNFSNYILPHPNMRVLDPNIRFFADHHTIGLYEQGDAGSGVGDFVQLRAWVLAHLMWNPKADEKALTTEFLKGYYGAAAPYLSAYLDLMHDRAERVRPYLRCFQEDTARWLDLPTLNEATLLFDKAQAAVAHDKTLSKFVQRERLTLDHAWLNRYDALRRQARLGALEFLGPKDPKAAVEQYIRTARQFNVGEYREHQPFSLEEERLRRAFRPPAPPPQICKGLKDEDWVDIQDHQFRLIKPGEWATIVDDPQASDGKAVRMSGDHHEWATHCPISADLPQDRPWHCYMWVRVEAKITNGPAMTLGLYDPQEKKHVSTRELAISDFAAPGYKMVDLGTWPLHTAMFFWAAPPKRPGEVTAVFVDRIVLTRGAELK